MSESKTYASLDSDLAEAIMKLFKLETGYLFASRAYEFGEWKSYIGLEIEGRPSELSRKFSSNLKIDLAAISCILALQRLA